MCEGLEALQKAQKQADIVAYRRQLAKNTVIVYNIHWYSAASPFCNNFLDGDSAQFSCLSFQFLVLESLPHVSG